MSGGKHRSTLKQTHKAFKSSHRTKGALKRASGSSMRSKKGRVGVRAASVMGAADHRKNRRNAAKIAQAKKKAASAEAKRAGTGKGVPRVVLLLPLSPEPGVGTTDVLMHLVDRSDQGVAAVEQALPVLGAPVTVTYSSLKARLTFLVAPAANMIETLDAMRAADVVVPIVDAGYGVDDEAQIVISAMLAQGMPAPLAILRNLDDVGGPPKNKNKTRKAFSKFLDSKLGGDVPLHTLDSDTDVSRFLQLLAKSKLRRMAWRDSRPYLLTESVDYDAPSATLRIGGYLRGSPLSANQLFHLPGKGTYPIAAIYEAPDPVPLSRSQAHMAHPPDPDAPHGMATLATRNPEAAHPLEQLLPPEAPDVDDDFAARMADFDDESDCDADDATGAVAPRPRAVPFTAAAKAAAINHVDVVKAEIQSDWAEFLALSDSDDDAGAAAHPAGGAGNAAADADDNGEYEYDDDEPGSDADDDVNPIQALANRQAEDFEWPDEFAAPRAPMCKDLFRGWRGLRSFVDSPWDAYEELPPEYSQIYEFESFPRTADEVLDEVDTDGVGDDLWIVIELADVPPSVVSTLTPTGVVVGFGLYRYERQFSVVHMNITRHASFTDPLESGSKLLIALGFRLLVASPMFSAENPKCSKNKFERFLQPGRGVVASIYGPIVFGTMPVLMFRVGSDGNVTLVATGAVHSVAPEKLLIKRIILTGEPFKIHKSKATVRRMFYNRDDIMWFKKIQIYSKFGRFGHITEPLGTHGYMKCQFDGILDARDTLCMPLYTRIYPKMDTVVVDADTQVAPQDVVEPVNSLLATI